MVHFKKYFYPSSLCIIGASGKPKSLGYELTRSVIEYGYTGKLHLVNPKTDSILGIDCTKSISDINSEIDLAIIMVPKKFAEETIQQLIEKGVKSLILITAGFKETGTEGAEAERRIMDLVKRHGVRLVGPNCMGIINTSGSIRLNATFVAEKPENGAMAFCSQSGAIGAAVLNSLRETDIRFAHFISVGNKADVNENDLLTFWEEDENIKVITYYLESFVNGREFINNFIENRTNKPVLVLKAGRTASGIKAASSHTGALGSSDKVVDAVLNQFGIIRSDSLTDMFNTAKGLENYPLPEGNRVAVLTNAGGPAILTVDTLEKNGLSLARLSDDTREKLKNIVHPEGSRENPVDLLPGGTAEQYKTVNEILAADENVDAIISVFVEPVMVKAFDVIEGINSINCPKPIMQVVMPLPEFWQEYRENSKYRKPLFRNPEEPAVVLSGMLKHYSFDRKKSRLKATPLADTPDILIEEKGFLSNEKVVLISKKYSLPLAENIIVKNGELKNKTFNYPVVVKAIGENLIHKSEFNAVRLNIKTEEELINTAKELTESIAQHNISVDGFLIQPFIKGRFELLVGAFRDPSFGPMVMFGTGGKYVEQINDTAICSAYLCESDLEELINSTNMGKIISGVRGESSADISAVKVVIKNVAQMMLDNERITELDLNPLIISETNELFAVDIRIKIS